MNTTQILERSIEVPDKTSLVTRMLNLLASPGDVFEEVASRPRNLANWRVPTLFVCLTGIILTPLTQSHLDDTGLAVVSPALAQQQLLDAIQPLVSAGLLCSVTVVGTFWSAFVLWLIGRLCLKASFSYLKVLEVVGLAGTILVLGTIVTALLGGVTGDTGAVPALSMFAGKLSHSSRMYHVLETLNVFHIWSTAVLAIGLSKVSGVSVKESAFWVFSYWLLARIGVAVLA